MITDAELWILIGPHWKLPVRLVWFDAIAKVQVASDVPMLRKQKQAAAELLSRICERREGENFFVLRKDLARTAVRAPDMIDPEDAVEWTPYRAEPEPEQAEPRVGPFIQKYCASPYAAIRDPLMADYVWISFCKWLLHWLLVEGEPADLVFAELVPLQARENWAQVLAKLEMNHCSGKERYRPDVADMVRRGVADLAVSDFITGWTGRYCDWTLAVRTKRDWNKMVERAEIERKRYRVRKSYFHGVYNQMRRQLPAMLEIYATFLEKAALPALKLYKSVSNGTRPKNGGAKLCGKPIPPVSPFLDRATLGPAEETPRSVVSVASEDDILLAMPALQPQTANLWDGYFSMGAGI